ncbi:MAG: Superoxide dismutase (Mn) [Microgenomates bacterium OLB23]|nr:MAG: Superoxide dismutase (Mn) [Microgenomates bacterium OLB23]
MFTLPDLPYDYSALEPHIDADTMRIHHDKHHGAYVTNLNAALEGYDEFSSLTIEDLIMRIDSVPESIRTTVRNNGGGHYNHSLFWQLMSPQGGGEPNGMLLGALTSSFGSFQNFTEEFNKAGLARFGSGWVWLVPHNKGLKIVSTPNQDRAPHLFWAVTCGNMPTILNTRIEGRITLQPGGTLLTGISSRNGTSSHCHEEIFTSCTSYLLFIHCLYLW